MPAPQPQKMKVTPHQVAATVGCLFLLYLMCAPQDETAMVKKRLEDDPFWVEEKAIKRSIYEDIDGSEPHATSDLLEVKTNLCMDNMQLFPGQLQWQKPAAWVPKACSLMKYTLNDVRKCLKEKKYLVIGDSVGEQVYRQLVAVKQHLGLEEVEWLGRHKTPPCPTMKCTKAWGVSGTGGWALGRLWDPSTAQLYAQNAFNAQLLAEADFVTFSQGTWDMGAHYCGVQAFYDMLKAKIRMLKAQMKPDGKLVLWGLHWFHQVKPWKHPASNCNHPEKARAFREAIRLAAACTDTGILETDEITKQAKHDTEDGVHYNNATVMVKLDLMLNAGCRTPAMRPYHPPPLLCEREHEIRAAWDDIPAANFGCGHLAPRSTFKDPTGGNKVEKGYMWDTCPAFKNPKYERRYTGAGFK